MTELFGAVAMILFAFVIASIVAKWLASVCLPLAVNEEGSRTYRRKLFHILLTIAIGLAFVFTIFVLGDTLLHPATTH